MSWIVALSVLFCVATLCGMCFGTDVNAINADGFEIIFLDYPAFVHEFHYSLVTEKFYAFGGDTFRQINHAPVFQAVDNNTLTRFDQPFIDVGLFSEPGKSDLWAIGPTYRAPGSALNIGYFLPLAAIGPRANDWVSFQGGKRGYTFYAVAVDNRNASHILAYFAGWAPVGESVSFVVTRTHIDLTQPPTGRTFEWDDAIDMVILYTDDFHPFHTTFKPEILYDRNRNILIVIDPASYTIFSVLVPADGRSPLQKGGSVDISGNGRLAGTTWHYYDDILYLGFAGNGERNGSIISVDLIAMKVLRTHIFHNQFYSNPRALAGRNTTLYIGFEGGPAIIEFDVNLWKTTGFARLPAYLYEVYVGFTGWDNVYFATHEQHSKVFRLSQNDFCTSECPYNGFCQKGVCQCNPGYELATNPDFCELKAQTITDIIVDKGAAIALGVLFAFTVVAAIAGWFAFYRAKKSTYTVVN